MTALTVPAAAAALGVSPATLRRWLAAGAPVARRGRRGRGCRTLVDPEAVRAWRQAQDADRTHVEAALCALAGRVPELLADAAATAHRSAPDKRNSAWALCASWQLAVGMILDDIRASGVDVSDPVAVPEGIERLRIIATR